MATRRWSSKRMRIRSGLFCGSIYWVLLVSGLVSVPKPLSQIQRSTRWLLQGLSPRTSFGGFGFNLKSKLAMPLDDVGPQGTTGTVEFQVGDADSSGIDLTPNLVGQAVLQGRSQAANDGTSVLVNQSGTQIDEFFTPEDGSFSFRLQAGSYSLKATRLGWLRVTRDITIVAGQTVDTARMRLRAGMMMSTRVTFDCSSSTSWWEWARGTP